MPQSDVRPQQARENPEPSEAPNPMPWFMLLLTAALLGFGVAYIARSSLDKAPELGDGRTLAELRGPAPAPAGAVIAGTAAFACLPLPLLWPDLRHAIESRMLWHMLVEFPALPSAATAVWMIPTLLDLALLMPAVAAAKYCAWWLAGWAIADGWGRLDPELRLWVLGNLAWMTGTAGLLYLDAPQRLCVNYLQDDRRHTGIALIALAVLLGAPGLREAMRPPSSA